MALFGPLATARQQALPLDKYAATFAYLEDLFAPGSVAGERLRSIAVGETRRLELGGGAFALEQVYLSKARPEGFFESHRRYIDVQVIFEGVEGMEVADARWMTVRQPYQDERDLITYEDFPAASRLQLRAGECAIFHPADVHMPGLAGAEGSRLVRKTVIKVPVA